MSDGNNKPSLKHLAKTHTSPRKQPTQIYRGYWMIWNLGDFSLPFPAISGRGTTTESTLVSHLVPASQVHIQTLSSQAYVRVWAASGSVVDITKWGEAI